MQHVCPSSGPFSSSSLVAAEMKNISAREKKGPDKRTLTPKDTQSGSEGRMKRLRVISLIREEEKLDNKRKACVWGLCHRIECLPDPMSVIRVRIVFARPVCQSIKKYNIESPIQPQMVCQNKVRKRLAPP